MTRTKDLKSQAELARQANMHPVHLCNCLKGNRNASIDIALALADLTDTDPRLWGRRGTIEDRQAAYEAWRAAQMNSSSGSSPQDAPAAGPAPSATPPPE